MSRDRTRLIATGSEWTFELIERYDREIARIADEYGLDTYPNQIEVISSEQMMDAYASVGMPVGYHHWSFGKQFLASSKRYQRGQMGLAYEIVINSNPCIAYLMEENTMTMQALVIAHACYGHNSFFKGNYLFRTWTDADAIIDYLVFARNYIAECEERHGVEAVEQLLDSCHALMNYGVDRYKRPSQLFGRSRNASASRSARNTCSRRSTTCGAPSLPTRDVEEIRNRRTNATPKSRRKTCSTSSRRMRRCWSPGSARSCASCARSRSTSIRSARPR